MGLTLERTQKNPEGESYIPSISETPQEVENLTIEDNFNSPFSTIGELPEIVVTKNKSTGQTSVSMLPDENIAFSGISAKEWVITPNGVKLENTPQNTLADIGKLKNPEEQIKNSENYLASNDVNND